MKKTKKDTQALILSRAKLLLVVTTVSILLWGVIFGLEQANEAPRPMYMFGWLSVSAVVIAAGLCIFASTKVAE